VPVGVDECPDLQNLLAKLLIDQENRLIRRGLDRGYVLFEEDTRAPRGRLLMDQMVKRQTMARGQAACRYDEFVHDVPSNQIIKATLRSLGRANKLEPTFRHELGLLVRRFEGISDIRLTSSSFRRVQLSRNTARYGLLLKICELVHHSLLPDENGAGSRFADILQDEVRMSAVFEDFLRNFYTYEQQRFTVGRDVFAWQAEALTAGALAYLPGMQTDITLRSSNRVIVTDAKYYRQTLTQFYGGSKLHATHLYQLQAYLRHAALRYPDAVIDGALIYPTVNQHLLLDYNLAGSRVRVATVDLTRPWPEIHQHLLRLLSEVYGDENGAVSSLAA
jgi:5-methylcytosine-specific restriction enzyme subunit McrC